MTSPGDLARLRAAHAAAGDGVVAFCRDLVRVPSPSGDEERAALRTEQEMKGAGFDAVEIDAAGNVLGVLRANAADPLPGAILLDAHLDHVDAGDPAAWKRPPFDGAIDGGRLWGRGATDTKSAVAAQVHAAALLRRLADIPRRRDVVVAAVVQEEVGGLGTAHLLETGPRAAAAIIGEPSLGGLAFGHRGRVEIEVRFGGRAAHASHPEWGLNPHGSMARFTGVLDAVRRDTDARLGRSTVAPTLVRASPASPNVIPESLTLTLDWRNVPGEEPDAIRERILDLAAGAAEEGVTVDVRTPSRDLRSWKGVERRIDRVSRGFAVEPDGAFFRHAQAALVAGLGREVPALAWDFASDGGWLAAAGIPCLGYGPGEMRVMHAADESVSIDLLRESVLGYALLVLALDEFLAAPGSPA